ncbi:hypothetical protein BT93_J1742 [Corymbia citriodora subsp. variegata]|nr:hypothetical protein BT93_J1742 [Corymbia citriodora subsp. variegata]
MDVRPRPPPSATKPSYVAARELVKLLYPNSSLKASDSLPLPLYLTTGLFFALFFSIAYFLLQHWRIKIRNSTPLHVVMLQEVAVILSLIASVIDLIRFYGVRFVKPFTLRGGSSDDWTMHEDAMAVSEELMVAEDSRSTPFASAFQSFSPQAYEIIKPSLPPLPTKPARLIPPPLLNEDDENIVNSVISGTTPRYSLESKLGDCKRAVAIRRAALQRTTGKSLEGLPIEGFDYDLILGQREYMVPMATTEGCLVASMNRGCKAIYASGGATATVLRDGMTRAPVVRFTTAARAAELKLFLEEPGNFQTLAVVFNRSSRFARLQGIKCAVAGKNLYVRFSCSTGDAMGMNMVSKGVQNVLEFLQQDFPDMDVIAISGNLCADKKSAAVNWMGGRGKSVVCEAVIKEGVVRKVLKTSVAVLVELNVLKNLAGSAMAGTVGGFNAHASNIVSAIFIATGQDPAQNVESSHCITMMEAVNDGRDLHISVTMPSIEVGTVGGGTQLASQSACLNLLGVRGGSRDSPGSNSRLLATIVAGAVLAGELSLMSSLATGQLVNSHMKYNRSGKDVTKVVS